MWFKRAISFGLDLKSMILFIVLSLFTTLSEIFGVSTLPIFQYIKYDGNINLLNESSLFMAIYNCFFRIFDFKCFFGNSVFFCFFIFLIRQIFII